MTDIASNWPVWRTNPADPSNTSTAPIVAGIAGVFFGGPLIGTLIVLIASLFEARVSNDIGAMGTVLMFSPMVSWLVLILAIPVSIVLARRGIAGWGMAMACGGIAGLLFSWIMGGVAVEAENAFFAIVGVVLALFYWVPVRLVRPSAIGVMPNRNSAQRAGR